MTGKKGHSDMLECTVFIHCWKSLRESLLHSAGERDEWGREEVDLIKTPWEKRRGGNITWRKFCMALVRLPRDQTNSDREIQYVVCITFSTVVWVFVRHTLLSLCSALMAITSLLYSKHTPAERRMVTPQPPHRKKCVLVNVASFWLTLTLQYDEFAV